MHNSQPSLGETLQLPTCYMSPKPSQDQECVPTQGLPVCGIPPQRSLWSPFCFPKFSVAQFSSVEWAPYGGGICPRVQQRLKGTASSTVYCLDLFTFMVISEVRIDRASLRLYLREQKDTLHLPALYHPQRKVSVYPSAQCWESNGITKV